MYFITKEKRIFEDEEYTVYGIRYDDEIHISDISANRNEVKKLVKMFNDGGLASYQMHDVLLDMIDR